MKVNVNNAQVNFVNGKITPDDGVTIASSEEEVATAAKAKILALVNEPAADTKA